MTYFSFLPAAVACLSHTVRATVATPSGDRPCFAPKTRATSSASAPAATGSASSFPPTVNGTVTAGARRLAAPATSLPCRSTSSSSSGVGKVRGMELSHARRCVAVQHRLLLPQQRVFRHSALLTLPPGASRQRRARAAELK